MNPATREEARRLLEMVFCDKNRFIAPAVVDEFFAQRLAVGDGFSTSSISDSWARREDMLDPLLAQLGQQPVMVIEARQDEVAPNADDGFHRLLKYLMVA